MNRSFAGTRINGIYGANNWNRAGIYANRSSFNGVRFDGSRSATLNRGFTGLNRNFSSVNGNSNGFGANTNRINRVGDQGAVPNGTFGNQRIGRNGSGNFAGRDFARNGNWNGNWNHHHGHHHDNSFIFFGGFGFPFYSDWDYGFYPSAYYPYYPPAPYYYDPYMPIDNGAPVYGDGSVPQDPSYNQSDDGHHYDRGGGAGDDHSLVSQVQEHLASGGYYKGSIDGVQGSRTYYAIRAYQREHHLPVTGEISDELLSDMGLR
ncbi:MAG: peptidoglycan-binding protein [Chthoniobacterales bacterium]